MNTSRYDLPNNDMPWSSGYIKLLMQMMALKENFLKKLPLFTYRLINSEFKDQASD